MDQYSKYYLDSPNNKRDFKEWLQLCHTAKIWSLPGAFGGQKRYDWWKHIVPESGHMRAVTVGLIQMFRHGQFGWNWTRTSRDMDHRWSTSPLMFNRNLAVEAVFLSLRVMTIYLTQGLRYMSESTTIPKSTIMYPMPGATNLDCVPAMVGGFRWHHTSLVLNFLHFNKVQHGKG